jgi:Protein of unknown function (DUF1572)
MNIFVNEYKRYNDLLEKTVRQISDDDFFRIVANNSNSIAIIIKHLSGNLLSRFTDFLTSDGEKEWRNRDAEFEGDNISRPRLMDMWRQAWQVLEKAVFDLSDPDMKKTVTIRGVEFTVAEALARSLAHFSYHTGQIVFMGKIFQGKNWQYLSIAPGQSKAYNNNPIREKGFREDI